MSDIFSPTRAVKHLVQLIEYGIFSDWEENFVRSIGRQSKMGDDTTGLSEKQLDVIEKIYNKTKDERVVGYKELDGKPGFGKNGKDKDTL